MSPAAEKIAHNIVARLRDDLDARLRDADPPPASDRLRAPREAGAPMALSPPRMGARDRDAARVIGRWLANATPKLRWRGVRVTYTGCGWHG